MTFNLSDAKNLSLNQYKSLYSVLKNQLFQRQSIQITLFISFLAIGVFSSLAYDNFLHLQAQNLDKLSVYNEIVKPLVGVIFLFALIVGMICSSYFIPYLHSRGHKSILQQSSLSIIQIAWLMLKLTFVFIALPIVYFVSIVLFIGIYSELNFHILVLNVASLTLGILLFLLATFSVNLKSKSVMISILASSILIVLIVSLDQVFIWNHHLNFLTLFNQLFLNSRDGVLSLKESAHLLIWLLLFFVIFVESIKQFKF
ncbi:MAG: hypothetical protein ACPGJI_02370, partial [Kangiellaceae bacterium]